METPCDISPPPITFFSSFIFITNAITAFWYEYYVYSLLFGMLTLTSLLYHSRKNVYTHLIDKVAILAVVLYGGYMVFHKQMCHTNRCIVITTFILSIVLFYYGYLTTTLCYHPDTSIGNKYHSLLHLISSIGHHCIIFL